MRDETHVPIRSDADIVVARQQGRAFAEELDFELGDLTIIATVISELARNIVEFAKEGEIILRVITRGGKKGIEIVARDSGPGIPDLPLAMQDGYSSKRSLGMGLPGTKRLADEFEIYSKPGNGTCVTVRKWLP